MFFKKVLIPIFLIILLVSIVSAQSIIPYITANLERRMNQWTRTYDYFTSLNQSGNNITADYFIGNGSLLTDIGTVYNEENFTTQYDGRTDRWQLINYTNLEDYAFRIINFTTQLDNYLSHFWNLENSTAQNYLKNTSDANLTTLLVKSPPVRCPTGTYMVYTNMTTAICVAAMRIDGENVSGFYNFSDNMAVNDTLYIIDGRVGIGNASPSSKLYVQGDGITSSNTGGAAVLRFDRTDGKIGALVAGTTGSGFKFDSSGTFTITPETRATIEGTSFPGFSVGLVMDSSGNVGIGTSSPSSKLHVIGNGNVTGNFSVSDNLFIGQSEIEIGNIASFTGLEKAMTFNNLILHDEGSVAFAFVDESDNKVLLALQVGEPESGGFWRNSMIISEDYNVVNATYLTNCELMQNMAGIPNRIHCNTTQYGASLYVEGNQQIGGHLYVGGSNKTTEDGITVTGVAAFILNNTDLEVFGNIHPKTQLIVEQGFSKGEQAQLLINTFSDGDIDPFYKREQIGADANNWDTEITALFCEQGECANANGGDGSADRLMEVNISTVSEGLVNISFYYGIENFDAGNVDNCSLTVYAGSNSYLLWNYTASSPQTDVTATLVERDFPSTLWQNSKVSIQFNMHSNNANEICHIDTIKVLGNTTSATNINVTTFNSRILLGDGSQSIFWNDTSKVLELPANTTIISETIVDLIISGTLTLGSRLISSFDEIVAGFQNETSAFKIENGTTLPFSNFRLENVSNDTIGQQELIDFNNSLPFTAFKLENVTNDTVGYSELFDFMEDNITSANTSSNAKEYSGNVTGTYDALVLNPCANNEILKYDTDGKWVCDADETGGAPDTTDYWNNINSTRNVCGMNSTNVTCVNGKLVVNESFLKSYTETDPIMSPLNHSILFTWNISNILLDTFKVLNFTTLLDVYIPNFWNLGNYTALEDSAFRIINFTTQLDVYIPHFWEAENFTAAYEAEIPNCDAGDFTVGDGSDLTCDTPTDTIFDSSTMDIVNQSMFDNGTIIRTVNLTDGVISAYFNNVTTAQTNNTFGNVSIIMYNSSCGGFRFNTTGGGLFSCT